MTAEEEAGGSRDRDHRQAPAAADVPTTAQKAKQEEAAEAAAAAQAASRP